jgi:hypothetical protein
MYSTVSSVEKEEGQILRAVDWIRRGEDDRGRVRRPSSYNWDRMWSVRVKARDQTRAE